MDSMRSLNTSLPTSSPHPSRTQPPEQLLQAFKTAALSVTNLYKNAVSDQAQARHLGYQEALEDLRAFLDRERIGLDDGEALKIRNWVTDRIDGSAACESEDERGEQNKRSRSLSPTATRKESPETHTQNHQSRHTSPRQETDAQPNNNIPDSNNVVPRAPSFTFSAGPQYPTFPQQQDIDMQANDVLPTSTTMSTQTDPQISNPPNMSSSPSVRVEVVSRGSRTPHRPNNGNRHIPRSSARDPNSTAGSKRKFHFGDFFDISSLGNGKDMFGGGKRGRYL